MTSRRIGEQGTRIRFGPGSRIKFGSGSGLKFKYPKMKETEMAKVTVENREPNSFEVARGWANDRLEAVTHDEEVPFDDLLDDCHRWCDRHGYKRPWAGSVGRILRERGCRSRMLTVKKTMISGTRIA